MKRQTFLFVPAFAVSAFPVCKAQCFKDFQTISIPIARPLTVDVIYSAQSAFPRSPKFQSWKQHFCKHFLAAINLVEKSAENASEGLMTMLLMPIGYAAYWVGSLSVANSGESSLTQLRPRCSQRFSQWGWLSVWGCLSRERNMAQGLFRRELWRESA